MMKHFYVLLAFAITANGCCGRASHKADLTEVENNINRSVSCHYLILKIMQHDNEVLSQWGEAKELDNDQFQPWEMNCQEKDTVSRELVRSAVAIPTIQTMSFSWSNADDDMLSELKGSEQLVRLYLDGLSISLSTVEMALELPNLDLLSIKDIEFDQNQLTRLIDKYPEIEVIRD